MLAEYGLIGLFFVVVLAFSFLMVIIPIVLKYLKIVPSNPNPVKGSIFECGMETIGKTWIRFNFRYYFYALMFITMDVMVLFLYPWATASRQLGYAGLAVISIFILLVMVGYLYAWRKKVLGWK